MAARPQWWVIPGAFVVLLRLLTLAAVDHPAGPAPIAAADASAAAVPLPATIAIRDASGNRIELPFAELAATTLMLAVPQGLAGERVDLRIWRRLGGQREATPWLTLRPRVRGDGTLPIAGLGSGLYDVELRTAAGTVLEANALRAPSRHTLR